MELQDYITNAVKVKRQQTFANSDQLTLGELILKLEPIVKKQKERDGEAYVQYDFEYFFPNDIDSWRGSYDELALNITKGGDQMSVSAFYKMLKETVGKTFTGYKGGEYRMTKNTPVWVANNGNAGNTAVINVVDAGYVVYIITGLREF